MNARHSLLGQLAVCVALGLERVIDEVMDGHAQNDFVRATRQEFQVGQCSSQEMARYLVRVANAQR